MKVVYLGNICAHIVRPLCDQLYQVYREDFKFVEIDEIPESRKGIGAYEERDYIVNVKNNQIYAQQLCDEADVLIFGFAPIKYIEKRIKENKLTIYYSERLFKQRAWRYLNPITIYNLYKRYIIPGKKSNFHLLCASSFTAYDFNKISAFKNKTYKWGYQPMIYKKDIDALLNTKSEDGLDFIWVGRLVKLKHCDDAIRVIDMLHKIGYKARMNIIGTGEEETNLKKLVDDLGLNEYIHFLGRCLIDETRNLMDNANIFMFTSDFGEGWGVTLNECMNSGVACVASAEAGATNFLIKDEENGLIYESGNIKQLFSKVKRLIDNKQMRESIAKKGYETIYYQWNTEFSCRRLVDFIKELQEKGKCDLFVEGPLSKAEPISHKWYKK